MTSSILKKIVLFLLADLIIVSSVSSQWSTNPSLNLMVCDTTGEQALSKIASTSDGGCYISWFDTRSGNYEVYLQRLDQNGFKMWGNNGLLISSNPQMTWLVDYDLIADHNDNAILVFSDIRNAGNLNVFAYKINPNGDFLWGANGVELSASTEFQPTAKVTETKDGNFVFTWIVSTTPSQVALQKLSSDGLKLWGASPILIQNATFGYSDPDVVPSDSDAVIVVYTLVTGNFPAQVVKLRAQKFNSNGQPMRGSNGVLVQDLGSISSWQFPNVRSDHENGALIAWYDDRDFNNLSSSFVQRVSSSGTLYFPLNGSECSIAPNRHHFYPDMAFDLSNEITYVFWVEMDVNQNQHGVYGQKFSMDGTRLWNDNGQVFKELSAPLTLSIFSLNAQMGSDRAYAIYLVGDGSQLNTKVEGFACDQDANFLWPGSFVTLSDPTQEKLQMVSTTDVYHNCKVSWGDKRLDSQGIYAQDINPDGQLGNPVVPVELMSFSAKIQNGKTVLEWSTATELNNQGFEIQRKLDNSDWTIRGFKNGSITSTEIKNYTFTDDIREITAKSISYRLKQVDINGSFNYSDEVNVANIVPAKFELEQNYPNPFNPVTRIKYSIPQDVRHEKQDVRLIIYDVLGRSVMTLVNEQKEAGVYEVEFNASSLASGIYYYRFTAGYFVDVKKMVLLK